MHVWHVVVVSSAHAPHPFAQPRANGHGELHDDCHCSDSEPVPATEYTEIHRPWRENASGVTVIELEPPGSAEADAKNDADVSAVRPPPLTVTIFMDETTRPSVIQPTEGTVIVTLHEGNI